MGLKDHFSHKTVVDSFDPDEQAAWRESQLKIKEAAKIAHVGQLKFQQADDHLTHAEAAKRDADEAARRKLEIEREAQAHLDHVESFKSKQPELHDARLQAAKLAEEKQRAAHGAHQEVVDAERIAREKSRALHDLEPQIEHHHHQHKSLAEKLAEHQRLGKEHEESHARRQAEYEDLRRQHDVNLAEVARLDKDHQPLKHELLELEQRLHALRERHGHSERGLHAAKERANHSHTRLHSYDPSEHNNALDALRKHKHREEELAAEVAAAKQRAHEHQDLHENYRNEHQRALDHHKHISGSVSPIMQEVEAARLAKEKAERELAEHEARAKHSHGQYRELMGHANDHGRRAAELQAQADKHTKGYHAMRREGDDALARKEALWEEAKNHGDTGIGHFKEKVTGLEARLDKIGDKIKDKLNIDGDGYNNSGDYEKGHGVTGHHGSAVTGHHSSSATHTATGPTGVEHTTHTSSGGPLGGDHITHDSRTPTSEGTGLSGRDGYSSSAATHADSTVPHSTHEPVTEATGPTATETTTNAPAPKKSGLKSFFSSK